MSKLARILALALALVMVFSLAACGETAAPAAETPVKESAPAAEAAPEAEVVEEVKDTLVVGYSNFSAKFSPFFAESAYDQDVVGMTQLGLIGTDRSSALVLNGIEGETRSYNGTDYFYSGIADVVPTENEDGSVTYAIKLRDDIVFSDGEPMTIDDVIFSLYVLCDPTYDGFSTTYAVPIVGMEEYRAGMDALSSLILAAGPDNSDFTFWTEEQQAAYWDAFQVGGEAFCQSIADYCLANYADYGAVDFPSAVALWGYEAADTAEMWDQMIANYGYDLSDDGINLEVATDSISSFISGALGDKAGEYAAGIATGESAPNIAGIVKVDDYNMTVTTSEVCATAALQLGISVAPLHIYGDAASFDYDNNCFGFPKGDLSSVRAVTTHPVGAGPYKFVSYENGQVTFEANENYWKGEPKIKYIVFQEASDADKLTGVATGTLDIADPSISDPVVASIQEYNGNGELTGPVITTSLVDNNGYGYMAMCADNVKVGDDAGSEASRNLRKGIATVFAVYRETAINSYYGDRAAVIEYPISNTSWAAPQPADEGYRLAYSTDVDGNPIYTEAMSETDRYDAALQACVGFLKAAGYTWDDAAGKFTAAPDGAKLVFEFQIPADGVGDHPAFGVITNAANALATIGIELQVNDLSDSSTLWDGLDAGTVDMWAAAWGNSIDPDMTQVYSTGSPSNHYHLADPEMDALCAEALKSVDQAFRKATYKEALELILDWGVEVPTYQRKNAVLFSTERVNMDTVTPDITTFWTWMNDIELLELN